MGEGRGVFHPYKRLLPARRCCMKSTLFTINSFLYSRTLHAQHHHHHQPHKRLIHTHTHTHTFTRTLTQTHAHTYSHSHTHFSLMGGWVGDVHSSTHARTHSHPPHKPLSLSIQLHLSSVCNATSIYRVSSSSALSTFRIDGEC